MARLPEHVRVSQRRITDGWLTVTVTIDTDALADDLDMMTGIAMRHAGELLPDEPRERYRRARSAARAYRRSKRRLAP